MKPRLIFITFVSLLALALAAGAGWLAHQALGGARATVVTPNPQPAQQPTVQTVNGVTVIVVSRDAQRAGHIEITKLAAVSRLSAISAYATVVDLQPLFDLRNRLAAARADVGTFTAQAATSRAQYDRSRTLFADDRNVSQKSLQDALATMQTDQAKLASAEAAASSLEAALRQQFGNVLTHAATGLPSTLLQRLQSGRAVVLRVTLPASQAAAAPAQIAVQLPGGQSIPGHVLSASPVADSAVQGSPWLYWVDQALPAGLRATARVQAAGGAVSGLMIPNEAIVWYGGQPWAYVRTAPDRFTRRYVPGGNEDEQGYLVTDGFRPGDAIVTEGAQLLLSEELKPQGIATACKDPPECDD